MGLQKIETCLTCVSKLLIGHSELPLASFSKRVLVLILSYENEISFTCKLNSFSYEWLCGTRPRFEREALGNSEMVYWRQKWVAGVRHGNSLVVRQVSLGRVIVVLF